MPGVAAARREPRTSARGITLRPVAPSAFDVLNVQVHVRPSLPHGVQHAVDAQGNRGAIPFPSPFKNHGVDRESPPVARRSVYGTFRSQVRVRRASGVSFYPRRRVKRGPEVGGAHPCFDGVDFQKNPLRGNGRVEQILRTAPLVRRRGAHRG